jgi:hypothetical protein
MEAGQGPNWGCNAKEKKGEDKRACLYVAPPYAVPSTERRQ